MKKIKFNNDTKLCEMSNCKHFNNCMKNAQIKNKDKILLTPEMFFDIDNGDAYCKTFDKIG